jgi:two-component system, OmpR family, heavy metal sensor histidine kinase CusS
MRPRLPSSITLRLSLLFTLALLVLTLGAGAYLYHALLLELTSRDENELRSKVMAARDVVAATPTVAALNDRHQLAEIIAGHERLSLYVLASGQLAYRSGTPGASAEFTRLPATAEPALVTSAGGLARAMVVSTTVADGSPVEIVVEFDAKATQQLLDSHLRQIALAVVLSALLGLAAAYAIARSGLRPLRTMAGTARRISVDQLAERLSVTEAPSELRELAGAFNAMLDRLQDSFTRLNEYSSDLAHEMRTPINNLIGQTQVVLARSRSHDDYRMALESNMEEFERLSRMVGDMLFIARAENPQTHLTRRPVDLRAVATKMQHFYEPIMAEKDVRLDVEGDATISGDPLIVERAVSNLVSNAVRHADAGTTVRLRIARSADATTFEVINRGPPIAPDLADRLFNRFARGAASDGLGLGLALVQSVMRLHHGSVKVFAEHAERTVRFVLSFPAAEPTEAPPRERRRAS